MDEKKGAVNIRGTWTEFPLYGSKDAKSFSNLEFSVDMSSKIRDILGAHNIYQITTIVTFSLIFPFCIEK